MKNNKIVGCFYLIIFFIGINEAILGFWVG